LIKKINNFSNHLISPDSLIKDAMQKINELGAGALQSIMYKFLIIADTNNILLGTITDGDIRRFLLHGGSINSSIKEAAMLKPRYGIKGKDKENLSLLGSISNEISFLPIIDKNNKIFDVLVSDAEDKDKKVTVILMAGGFGKRLGKKTINTPKPLLNYNGKPIIDYVLDLIKKSYYVSKIIISTHYLSEEVEKHFKSKKLDIPYTFIREDKPLGTAGCLSLISEMKEENDLLVINGDVITNLHIDSLIKSHNLTQNDATISAAKYSHSIPFGVLKYNNDGEFVGLDEKPDINQYVSAGIYLLSSKFLSILLPNEEIDMPELINRGKEIGFKVGVFAIHENWSDIGRPEDFK